MDSIHALAIHTLDSDNASIKLNANYVLHEIISRIRLGEQHFYFRSSIIAACEIMCMLAADHHNPKAKALISTLQNREIEIDESIIAPLEIFIAEINQKIPPLTPT